MMYDYNVKDITILIFDIIIIIAPLKKIKTVREYMFVILIFVENPIVFVVI